MADEAHVVNIRVGFDIGGTFTDILVSASTGEIFAFKVLSTPEQIAQHVVRSVQQVLDRLPGAKVQAIVHGTTIASNAVIENKRAATGYLTTAGFRDDIEFTRPRYMANTTAGMYFPPPTPLVPRHLRVEIDERMTATGKAERPPDVVSVEAALDRLVEKGIEALAICLINAHVNPAHEIQIAEIARRRAPHLEIVASHKVSPLPGEHERASTTVLHASLTPVVKGYLERLQADLHQFPDLMVMQANGGVIPAQRAKLRPATLIESGPAAGVLAAAMIASQCGVEAAVALDMGGTTVKVCLIEDGRPRETAHLEVSLDTAGRLAPGSGHTLLTSGFDLVEIGAGGGSIAWLDDGGALRVGPNSAGATPGPACYGLGGHRPTITDAAVVLGYLNHEAIAGGTVPIRSHLAERAIDESIARVANMTVQDAAYGICRVAVANMRRAVRMVTIQRGCDPRRCTLIAFGGASPLLAAALAEELDIGAVYVPRHAGLFSAFGLLAADMRIDVTAALATSLDEIEGSALMAQYDAMLADASVDLARSGVDVTGGVIERSIDLRYIRQGSELTICLPAHVATASLADSLARAFHLEHERQFGYHRPDSAILAAALRLRILIKHDWVRLSDLEPVRALQKTGSRYRAAYFGHHLGWHQATLCGREALVGDRVPGPVIVEEFDTTIVVPPGWEVTTGALGSVVLERLGMTSGS
jgi:N-methylhydantoinase A/oxoprolinase/acetone carboxylase beta subunit